MPPPQVRARLAEAAADLQVRLVPGGRATDAARLHVTLVFLGEFAADSDAPARACWAAARVREDAFDLVLDSAGSFTGARPPWVLSGSKASEACLPLRRALQRELHDSGFQVGEARDFVAHVTFVRHADFALPEQPIVPIAWPVRDFALLESHPAERRYDELARWPLR